MICARKLDIEGANEPLMVRNGMELTLSNSKVNIDPIKLIKEIRKLAILRYPLFEVYWKSTNKFREWELAGAQMITPPDIQGHRIPVNIESLVLWAKLSSPGDLYQRKKEVSGS